MSVKFVVVASLRRGVYDAPEELGEAGQAAAFRQMRADEGRELRAAFESRRAALRWAHEGKKPAVSEPDLSDLGPAPRGLTRMLQLLARVR